MNIHIKAAVILFPRTQCVLLEYLLRNMSYCDRIPVVFLSPTEKKTTEFCLPQKSNNRFIACIQIYPDDPHSTLSFRLLNVFYVLLTVHLGIMLVNNQLDTQFFFVYVYFNSLHVSSTYVLIIRRINFINTTSGICHST